MDEEVFEKAKEEDLSIDEAEHLQDLVEETGLEVDDTFELFEGEL
jgi:predicted DsbA family dithiol-disulfide isomerase